MSDLSVFSPQEAKKVNPKMTKAYIGLVELFFILLKMGISNLNNL
jgi:hypothetical protein